MIDHVSIAVRDLDRAARFYQAVLGAIGYEKLVVRPRTIGFGKAYPEFWLNLRATMAPVEADGGTHVALRVRTIELVDAFHAAALAAGSASRRAGPAAATRRRLLRGLHPRSRRQPHRGGDVSQSAGVMPLGGRDLGACNPSPPPAPCAGDPLPQGERVSEHALRRSLHLIVPCSWFCLQRTPLPSPLAGEGVEPPKRSEDGEAGEGVPCLALHPLGGHRGHLFFHLGNRARLLE